jgi:hypothetical protein
MYDTLVPSLKNIEGYRQLTNKGKMEKLIERAYELLNIKIEHDIKSGNESTVVLAYDTVNKHASAANEKQFVPIFKRIVVEYLAKGWDVKFIKPTRSKYMKIRISIPNAKEKLDKLFAELL